MRLRTGNIPTHEIADMLRIRYYALVDFYSNSELSCLELE